MGTTGVVRSSVYAGLAGVVTAAIAVYVPAGPAMAAGEPLTTAAKVSSTGFQAVRDITSAGGRAFFVGTTAQHGAELWTSDGTTEGTALLADIGPGSTGGVEHLMNGSSAAVGSILYFVGDDGAHGGTLWRTDGTNAGTTMVKDVLPASTTGLEVFGLTVVGSTLFFQTFGGSGLELWKSNGSGVGTVKVADGGACGSRCYLGSMAALGTGVVFVGGANPDGELWFSDGTSAGTKALGAPAIVRNLTVSGAHAYATVGTNGDLWQTDGTTGGTKALPGAGRAGDFVASYSALTDVSGELFYMVDYLSTSTGEQYELRRVDRVSGNGTFVKGFPFGEGGVLDDRAQSVVASNGLLYFVPVSSGFPFFPGHALWRSDGTTGGTTKLLTASVYRLGAVGDQVLFARAGVNSSQWQVWRSDGSIAGTQPVTSPNFNYPFGPDFPDDVVPSFADVGGRGFFTGRDLASERGLWKVGNDVSGPDTRITGGFADGQVVTSFPGDTQRFTFAADDDFTPTAGTTFQVKYDDLPWFDFGPTYDAIVRDFGRSLEGPHSISVRAVDAAGHVDPTPATRTFVLDLEPPEPLVDIVEPIIGGTAAVGQQLTVTPARWFAQPQSRAFQWLRDGAPIAGATGTTYVVKVGDVGHRLAVREHADAAGFIGADSTSDAVTVAKVASTSKLKLKSKAIAEGKRAKAVVKVTAAAPVPVTGKVTILVGRKKVGSATLVGGKATVKVKLLPPGGYKLKVTYAGSAVLASSTSTKVKLVVG
jgi:ELWxxDGT repeat protein